MRVVIEIRKDMEEELLICAEKQGKDIGSLVKEMLKEMMILVTERYGSGKEEGFHLR